MPSIIVHIGPPKTATTSLQIALEQIEHPDFYYGGTLQPRLRNAGSLCQRVYQFCSNPSEAGFGIEQLKREIEGLLQASSTVFLSEEMILLEQDGAPIKEKLSNLKEVLRGFDYKILITARPGRDALPSLYQEIFNSLPLHLQIDFDAFCSDQRATCYDYSALCKILAEGGRGNIVVLEFNKISTEGINLSDFSWFPNFETNVLTLQKTNSGRTGQNASARILPRISLKSLGRLGPLKSLIDRLGIRGWLGYQKIVGLLDSITLRAPREQSLLVPEDVAKRLDQSYLDAVSRYGVYRHDSGVGPK